MDIVIKPCEKCGSISLYGTKVSCRCVMEIESDLYAKTESIKDNENIIKDIK